MYSIHNNLFDITDRAQLRSFCTGVSPFDAPDPACMLQVKAHAKCPVTHEHIYSHLWHIVADSFHSDIKMVIPRILFNSDCDAACVHALCTMEFQTLLVTPNQEL